MTQLTKEFFKQTLKDLATKKDLEGLATKKDLENFVTKEYFEQTLNRKFEAHGEEMAKIINQAFQEHQDNFLQEQFDRLSDQLSLTTEVRTLRIDLNAVKQDVAILKKQKV